MNKNLHKIPLWLAPVFNAEKQHWSLLIINFSDNIILHIDSLHSILPPTLINNTCILIEKVFSQQAIVVNWDQWKYYTPIDVPKQVRKNKNISMNCGVHLSWWIFIICTGTYINFTDDDMDNCRKGIATYIFEKEDISNKREKRIKVREELTDIYGELSNKCTHKLKAIKKPSLNYETTLQYCSMLKKRLSASL